MRQIGGKYYSRKGLSIKQKVTIWYACMLVLIVLLLFGFILTISRNLLQRESDSRLEKIVLDFIDDIDFEYNWYELDDDVRFFEDGVIFSLYDEQGRLTAGSVPTDFPADTVLKAYSFQTFSAAGHNWSVYDAALPYGDGKILWIRGILQAETLFSVERTMFLVLLIACPLLIALALLVGLFHHAAGLSSHRGNPPDRGNHRGRQRPLRPHFHRADPGGDPPAGRDLQ